MDMKTKTLESFILDIQNFKKLRLFGSAALSLAMVSKGAAEVYREDNIAIWDVAAGIPIVLAAGGKCIFETGNGENYLNVIATNGNLEL
jgi:fructose-1,6-bisphosphatase/inositol monophosphatase family enzyme